MEESQQSESQDTQEEIQKYDHVKTGIDSADNKAEKGDIHKVYLTFDSSPGENTDKILDVLQQYDVKATFFVSGDMGAIFVNKAGKRIVDESAPYTHFRDAIAEQKDKVAYVVMDQKMWDRFYELMLKYG